ncbi:MAG: acyl carrier protein [Planctomycetes bacterium]|jgi:acyl carrier protein|nr:acyl carrier protein [Planctomycetota bacterium]MDP6410723.1 acyl carrier protein [Planctomycetota bacterium]
MVPKEQVQASVKQFILSEFLPGEDAGELETTTPLVSAGILDSIATLKLVTFLEEQFSVQIDAHEADVDHLNTVEDISNLVLSKL